MRCSLPNWDLFEGSNDRPSIRINGVPDGTRIVVVSDAQVPMEDRELLSAIFDDFVPAFKPAGKAQYHLFLNGDILDNFTLSTFLARVTPKFTLGDEVDMVKAYLAQWGKLFTHKHYVMGNHEDRWEKAIYFGNPQFARFTVPLHDALDLANLGYDWVPYLKHYDFEGFIITHGDIATKYTASKMLENYHASGVSGHANRPQSYTWADAAKGEATTWYVQGMTCRQNIGDIIKDWRKIQPWQQGFLIGEVQDGILHVELVRVHHGSFRAAGKVYRIGNSSGGPSGRVPRAAGKREDQHRQGPSGDDSGGKGVVRRRPEAGRGIDVVGPARVNGKQPARRNERRHD